MFGLHKYDDNDAPVTDDEGCGCCDQSLWRQHCRPVMLLLMLLSIKLVRWHLQAVHHRSYWYIWMYWDEDVCSRCVCECFSCFICRQTVSVVHLTSSTDVAVSEFFRGVSCVVGQHYIQHMTIYMCTILNMLLHIIIQENNGIMKDLHNAGLHGRLPCFIEGFLRNRNFCIVLFTLGAKMAVLTGGSYLTPSVLRLASVERGSRFANVRSVSGLPGGERTTASRLATHSYSWQLDKHIYTFNLQAPPLRSVPLSLYLHTAHAQSRADQLTFISWLSDSGRTTIPTIIGQVV